jgi:tetratricopeptide (TPR) repeat protein
MGAGQDAVSTGMSPVARVLARAGLGLVATVHVVLGRRQRALEIYERILELDPRHEATLASAGNLRFEIGDADGAVAIFRRLVAIHPESAEGWFNLGFLLEKRDDLTGAEAAFRRAIALRPALDRAWYGLGLTLIRDDRLREAVDALKQTIKLQPFSPYGFYQLGMTYHHLGESLKAQRICDELRKFEPRYAATLLRDMQAVPRKQREEDPCR